MNDLDCRSAVKPQQTKPSTTTHTVFVFLFGRFKVNPADYMPYFSLGACMEGLNIIFQNLFDITLENVDPGRGELWSDDVQKLVSSPINKIIEKVF